MPELIGIAVVVLVIVLGIVLSILYAIGKWLVNSLIHLCRLVTGKERREAAERDRQYEQFCEANDQFIEAVLSGSFPSEKALCFLVSHHSLDEIPENLWGRLGYRAEYGKAIKHIRKVSAERRSNVAEFKELRHSFLEILTTGKTPYSEGIRAAQALHGEFNFEPFVVVLRNDILQILRSLTVANGSTPESLGRIYQAVRAVIEPDVYLTVDQAVEEIVGWEHKQVTLPLAIERLRVYDNVAQLVASGYSVLIEAASARLPHAMPVTMVRYKYFELLKPFISRPHGSESSSGSRNDGERTPGSNWHCIQCSEYYSILRLQADAKEEEVKTAYRDLAQIYHPDRFASSHDRLRQKAEGEMKRLNMAYSHIMEHFQCAKV